MADATYQAKVYRKQGGNELVVASTGKITVESGGVQDFESGSELRIAGTAMSASAAELNLLDGVTAGTATASKAAVLGANKNLDTLVIADSGLKLGSSNGTAVTATAAELNKLAAVTAGTASASKAAVLGANKNLDTLVIADGGLKLGSSNGTAVTATAAEINKWDGRAHTATIVIGAEAANVVNATVQLKDAGNTDLAIRGVVDLYLTTSTGGDSLAASPSGGFAIGTDGLILGFHTTGRAARVVSESDGDIDINVTETGASATKRLAVVLPNGDVTISTGIMTFTTV